MTETNCERCIHFDVCDRASRLLWARLGKEKVCSDFMEAKRWIPVTERLPEEGEYVLCVLKGFNYGGKIGHDRQIRIAQAVNVLCKQNLSWLLEKMKDLGFRVMPDGRVVYAMDETGKAVRF